MALLEKRDPTIPRVVQNRNSRQASLSDHQIEGCLLNGLFFGPEAFQLNDGVRRFHPRLRNAFLRDGLTTYRQITQTSYNMGMVNGDFY